jgi:hypothetical protein
MIGITGQSISMLAELDASQSSENRADGAGAALQTAARPGQAAFSELLDRFKRHG